MNGLSVKVKIEGLERLEKAIESLEAAAKEFGEAAALVTVITGAVSNVKKECQYVDCEEEATKRLNELIIKLCDYIEKMMESDSAADHEQLPSLVEALAMLINLHNCR